MTTLDSTINIVTSGEAAIYDLRRLVDQAALHGLDAVKGHTIRPRLALFANMSMEGWSPEDRAAGWAIIANRLSRGAETMLCTNISRRTLAATPALWPYLRKFEDLKGV